MAGTGEEPDLAPPLPLLLGRELLHLPGEPSGVAGWGGSMLAPKGFSGPEREQWRATVWRAAGLVPAVRPAGTSPAARSACRLIRNTKPPKYRLVLVAVKPGNAGRAKGCRKVDERGPDLWKSNRRQCQRLNKSDRPSPTGTGSNLPSGPRACWRPSTRGSKEVSGSA